MGFVPLLPLPSSRPEHFILVTVPEARPRRTFEIKHCMKYSVEKREEKGAISAPQACKSRAFVMPLKVFFFQPATNHVLGCPREPISMMEISTLALPSFLLSIVALLLSRHCKQLNFYRKKGVFLLQKKKFIPDLLSLETQHPE